MTFADQEISEQDLDSNVTLGISLFQPGKSDFSIS